VTPDGKIAKLHEGTNPGRVQLGWAPKGDGNKPTSHPERADLQVAVDPVHTGKTWGLVLWAAGDIACRLEGIPPYLARNENEWFAVENR